MKLGDDIVSSVVPRVTTKRLLLRAYRPGDLDAYAAHMADPIAVKYVGGVVDRRAAWRNLGGGIGFWLLNGGGWWGTELRETGELVGTVGAFFRETSPELELGWTVFRSHWGKGYATEAASAALAFALERHGVDRAIAHINPENVASVRVSEHLGMRFEGEVDFYGESTGRYATQSSV